MAAPVGKKSAARGAGKKTASSDANSDGNVRPPGGFKLADLVKPGAVFSVWSSDYDASDLYPITIESIDPNGALVLSYGTPTGKATLRCEAASTEQGQGVVFLSQFAAMTDGDTVSKNGKLTTATHSAPFLLSRALLAKLSAGEEVTLSVYSGSFAVKKVGTAQATVRIHEKPVKVQVLHAQDTTETDFSPVDLWVLDHPVWPILLKLEFGGECELSLFEIEPAK
ncbi:MAG TPA: hypothetical protein PKL17_08835 [Pseudomonadota bacterium]|nr:hypothetical protein [Pseudomonadota bacterium]